MTKETAFKAVIAEIPAQLDLDQMDVLNRKVDQMLRLMDDQVHLQKVSLLEAGHMLRFNGPKGRRISLSLPDAQDDYVQRVILRTRSFYEVRLLATVEAMGIVGKDSVVCDVGANIGNHTIYFGTADQATTFLAKFGYKPSPIGLNDVIFRV